jgi:hypothetical protein
MSTIKVGDKGTFYPYGANGSPGESIRAKVIHVWSDTCVNLQTDKGHTPTSVLVHRAGLGEPGAPTGYVFIPDPKPNAVDPIETLIQAKGLTAPRVTPADIEAVIATEHYFTAANGALGALIDDGVPMHEKAQDTASPLHLLTFCVLVLKNGFTVTGESACASTENFDAEVGRKIARSNAVQKIWPLMGYELRTRLAAATA